MLTLYSPTAGSFIETSLSTESESPNLFIINQTCLQYTTAGSLIQSSLLARSMRANEILSARNPKSQTPEAGRRVQCGAQPGEASNTLTRRPATHNRTSDSRARPNATMSGASGNIRSRRISRGRLAFIRRRQGNDTIPFAIRPTK